MQQNLDSDSSSLESQFVSGGKDFHQGISTNFLNEELLRRFSEAPHILQRPNRIMLGFIALTKR